MRARWWILMLLVAVVGGGAVASLLQGGGGDGAAAGKTLPAEAPEPVVVSVHATPIEVGGRTWYALALGLLIRQETTLAFTTAQRFDFAVYAPAGPPDDPAAGAAGGPEALWRWSADRMFAQVLGQETYEADRLYLFTAAWDGTGQDGEPLPPGRYRLEGRLTTSTRDLAAHGWVEIP